MKHVVIGLLAALVVAPVQAYQAGDWLTRFGVATVQPDPSGDQLAGADLDLNNDTRPGFTATYMVNHYFGVELLAAFPFQHNIYLEAGGDRMLVGETKHLPPTVLAQLYFPKLGAAQFYAGLGFNYTAFFEENLRDQNAAGIPAGFSLELDDSTGMAGELGVDFDIGGDWFLNASAWVVDIDTTATVEDAAGNFAAEADLEIDPVVWMLGVGRKF
jgi:outer membrane protein